MTKTCIGCKKSFPLSHFRRQRRECKKCLGEKYSLWRIAHPGYSAKSSKEWRIKNPELVRQRRKQWRKDNPSLMAIYRKRSIKRHWEGAKKRAIKYYWEKIFNEPELVRTALLIYEIKRKVRLYERQHNN